LNKKLEEMYNKMDFTQNTYLKSYMKAFIILDEQTKDTNINELDGWILEEFQLLSDLINKEPIIWCIRS